MMLAFFMLLTEKINRMHPKNLISITDFSKDDYLKIMELAAEFEKEPNQDLLKGKVVASLFFEPSTRTRLSFETAITRLGGRIIGFTDSSSSSVTKGETLHDTIRMVSNYADMIVMRHPLEGSARYASQISGVPVINAGDGANQHPTQTLLDMYSITKTQGRLDNINIFLVGDLKYGRTVHSLLQALSVFDNPIFNFVAPPELAMPIEYKRFLDSKGIRYFEHTEFNDIISEADIIYMTRVQKERFNDPIEYEKVKNIYILKNSMLENTKPTMKILHPLPRINEIHTDVDSNPKAYYFTQALNGLYTREAIISHIMGLK
jgi:aspartate carbamoyltransferase catalytic subunit